MTHLYECFFLCLQLIEQALAVEEQLRKSVSENPGLVECTVASLASIDKSVFCLPSNIHSFAVFSLSGSVKLSYNHLLGVELHSSFVVKSLILSTQNWHKRDNRDM